MFEKRYTKINGKLWPNAGQGLLAERQTRVSGETLKHYAPLTATIIKAYSELVFMPEDKRNAICKKLREAKQ